MDTDEATPTAIPRDDHGRPTREWLVRAYVDAQRTILDIARETGDSKSTVFRWLQYYAIPTRRPVRPLSREELERRYITEDASAAEIAETTGIPVDTVYYLLKQYGIERKRPKRKLMPITAEWLYQKYLVEGLSFTQITALTGHGSYRLTVLCRRYGIPTRYEPRPPLTITRDELYQLHVVEGLTAVRIAARLGCHNSAISRLIKEYGLDPERPLVNIPATPPIDRDLLWKLYWVDQLSAGQIAQQYGVSRSTALRWFVYHDVSRRKWNGGEIIRTYTRSSGPERRYGREFNARERERILSRDGNRCRMPGCGCQEAWRLQVHHIIPVNLGGTNALDNGITLCQPCHDSITRREMAFAALFQQLLQTPN